MVGATTTLYVSFKTFEESILKGFYNATTSKIVFLIKLTGDQELYTNFKDVNEKLEDRIGKLEASLKIIKIHILQQASNLLQGMLRACYDIGGGVGICIFGGGVGGLGVGIGGTGGGLCGISGGIGCGVGGPSVAIGESSVGRY
ncbi:hypothetical protein T459_16917 [Capsicum annuum]|uniref:Uncharacterized protein n=1 Tax=Capsicum annuum TaxID=4072 RepID=A0A2G2ZAH1_CAPAN|nr:hypothetical protein T459_16917 [Capsicum annuum]